jgi:hypothetical protein
MKFKTKQVDKLFNKAIEIFGFEFEMPIVWLKRKLGHNNIATWQNSFVDGFGEYHTISLDFSMIKSKKDMMETLLHELIHAWQYETDNEIDHDIEFLKWVAHFSKLGYDTSSSECDLELYLKIQNGEIK